MRFKRSLIVGSLAGILAGAVILGCGKREEPVTEVSNRVYSGERNGIKVNIEEYRREEGGRDKNGVRDKRKLIDFSLRCSMGIDSTNTPWKSIQGYTHKVDLSRGIISWDNIGITGSNYVYDYMTPVEKLHATAILNEGLNNFWRREYLKSSDKQPGN
jgi:hypothetical protein